MTEDDGDDGDDGDVVADPACANAAGRARAPCPACRERTAIVERMLDAALEAGVLDGYAVALLAGCQVAVLGAGREGSAVAWAHAMQAGLAELAEVDLATRRGGPLH